MIKRLLPLLIAAFVFCGCSKEEEKGGIYGIVTTTGEPLRGLNVSLYKEASVLLSAITYDDGHYEFSELTPGEYTLKVSTEGYQLHYASVVVEAGRQACMDIQLVEGSPDNNVIVLQSDGIMVQQYDLSSGIELKRADSLCSESRVGDYSDWRLPTQGEIKALYGKRNIIGNFSNEWYWMDRGCCNFSNGEYEYSYSLGGLESYRVRAVRTYNR